MKKFKFIALAVCVVMLITSLSVGATAASTDTKRPDGFEPWFSFENLNEGAKPYITDENDKQSCTIKGIDTILADFALEQKVGILDCSVVSGGNAGKLLSYGAGPKLKTDNTKYKDGVWWPIKIDELGDENYCNKKFTGEKYFCFYIDMTKWTVDSRKALENTDYFNMNMCISIGQIGTDGATYSATSCLEAGKPYDLQDENGKWKSVNSDSIDNPREVDVTLPSTGETIKCQIKNGTIKVPCNYKGYIRFKISDTYPLTYYDATNPAYSIDKMDTFTVNSVEFLSGLYPQVVGVGDDMTEPGHLLIGDFGFMKDDVIKEDENSQGEASKIEESAKDTDNTAVIPEAKTDANTTTTAKADKNASVPKTGDTAPLSLMVIGLIAVGSALVVKHKK